MSELLQLNVSEHTEKKNGLSYLSWAWAWAEALKHDPKATWEVRTFQGLPFVPISDSAMVCVEVKLKGMARECWLPVMDHRNKAIKNPDAFAINTAIMRCMTKALSMHGLGLYIYAGEDLPEGAPEPTAPDALEATLKASIEAVEHKGVISASKLAYEALSSEQKIAAQKAAPHIVKAMPDANRALDILEMAMEEWHEDDRQDFKAGLWHLLDSKTRSALKRQHEANQPKETA